MLAIIQSKIFCFPISDQKTYRLKYTKLILPGVLYRCETWSLTFREEHRLRVFENIVLRRIFGPEREEDGAWRKLHNNELLDLLSSLNFVWGFKSSWLSWEGHVACMGVGRGGERHYGVLVGRPKSKRPLGRPRHRWEDNIKVDLRE
jgi:hypothetical protein